MSYGVYPTLLDSKAKILANFTRSDLVVLGSSYLILSWMKVSGILALVINIFVYLVLKFFERRLERGFLKNLRQKQRDWSYQLGRLL